MVALQCLSTGYQGKESSSRQKHLSLPLRKTLMSQHVLTMPNFDKDFVLECDASKEGIGVVLMQNGHPLAYISQGLKGKVLALNL